MSTPDFHCGRKADYWLTATKKPCVRDAGPHGKPRIHVRLQHWGGWIRTTDLLINRQADWAPSTINLPAFIRRPGVGAGVSSMDARKCREKRRQKRRQYG